MNKYKTKQAITSSSRDMIVTNESFEQESTEDKPDSPLDDEKY